MSSPNDPADVFIGYSRRDGLISPALFSTLLAPDSIYATSFMKLNTRFYDARLVAGDDWGEELEKHAAGCKVFVALLGPEWINVLKERNEGEDGVPITIDQRKVTDWVYKELDLALERDEPAAVQVVCINGASFDTSLADELFPPGKVRDYFRNPPTQILKFRDDGDNQAFCNSIRNLLEAHHRRQAASGATLKTRTIFEKIDPWLRFINRDNVWTTLKEKIGAGIPKEATYDYDQNCQKSVALLVAYDHRKDEPRELIRGVSHHLYVKGCYEAADESVAGEASSDENWYAINSFGWPANGRVAHLFESIFNALNIEYAERLPTFDNPQQEFVTALVKLYAEKRLSPCIYTSIKASDKKDLKLALEFAEIWNNLNWSELPTKLVLTIAVRTADTQNIQNMVSNSSVTVEPIGAIDADCIEDWIEGFLQDRLRLDNLTPAPSWWKQVQDYSGDDSIKIRFSEVKSCFDSLK